MAITARYTAFTEYSGGLTATTNLAARKFLSASGLASATLSYWIDDKYAGFGGLGYPRTGCHFDIRGTGSAPNLGVSNNTADAEGKNELVVAGDSGAPTQFFTSISLALGVRHMAVVLDVPNSQVVVYQNGVQAAVLSGANYATWSSDVAEPGEGLKFLEQISFGPVWTKSTIWNIAIFDSALTATDVLQLFNTGDGHDVRDPHGSGWPGTDAPFYWCTAPLTGDIPNSGSGGVCALTPGAGIAVYSDPVPATSRSRSGSTYRPVGTFWRTNGTSGSFLRDIGIRAVRFVFPDGGGIGGLSWRFWLRRPLTPVVTGSGTIGQITIGGNIITIGIDATEHITVTADDGTTDVTDTAAEPLSGFTWTAVTMVVDPTDETLIVYVSGEAVAELDLSGLTFSDADSGMSFTVGVEADGSNPLDFDFGNSGVWDGPLTEGEVAALDSPTGPGPLFDPGNVIAGTPWDGTNIPDIVWVGPGDDEGVIPDEGDEGDEPLVAVGVEVITWNESNDDSDVPAYDFGYNFGHPSELPSDDAPGSGTGSLSLWHMPSGTGYPSGSGATQDGSTALSDTIQAGWSALFWMRVTQSDEGAWAIDFSNATFGGVLVTISASFASFVVDLVANNTEIFASAPTSANIPTGSLDFYSVEIDGDGVSRMYRNAELIAETPATPAGPPPGEDDAFVFQAQNYNTLDVTNLMVLDRVMTSDERIALTAATASWNYTDTFDDGLGHVWTGVSPAFYYPNGELTNSGDGGTCDIALIGSGSVITEGGGESTETLSFGCYDFHDGSAMSYADPMAPGLSIVVVNRTGEFGNDGGAVVRLYSPSKFSHAGPYDVRLVDADGNYWPPMSQSACYSAVAGALDAVMANRSREYLEFALPKLPQGVYAIRLSWNGGMSEATFDEMITVVPADTSLESSWLVKGWR